MAVRTTSEAVAKIIDVDEDEVPDLSPFIETASSLVDEVCVGVGYADARLELIERWLAAHFYAIRDPRLQSQNFGGAGGALQGQTAMNFQGTSYGQQAMLLDSVGGLARLSQHVAMGKRGVIGITHIGTVATSEEQAYYQDRPQ
jgi:hypothetical protein